MERVRRGGLLEAFQHKGGRFEKVISTIPLYAVNEDRWGALLISSCVACSLRGSTACPET